MRKTSVFVTSVLLAACGGPDAETPIALSWEHGQTFHLGASYRAGEVMNTTPAVALDGSGDVQFGETWSSEIIWTYQVVESGLIPTESDELYKFSVTATGEIVSLTVIKAFVDGALNTDADILNVDPVVYLVFREDRDRLAAIVSFSYDNDGNRTENAWSASELGRSYSTLSQTQLTKAPALLAPFGSTWGNDERMLENGSFVSSFSVDRNETDVVYEDELGGDLITSRYEFGQPWPTFTASDNMETRLLTDDEVADARIPGFMLPDAPEDFDYRAALKTSIDLDTILTLDEETMNGGWTAEVYDEFKPWAGSWWPLKSAKLVFGSFGGSCSGSDCTYSRLVKKDVDEFKVRMDKTQADLRDMDKSDPQYEELVKSYRDDQEAVTDVLVAFYNGIREGLDGGTITVMDGKISKAAAPASDVEGAEEEVDEGWSYDLDALSPMDKFALEQYFRNPDARNNPFFLQAWELLNSYNPGGGSWWGHCNGWAGAAILTNEPRESVEVDINGNDVEYTTADIKGLFTEAHYSTYSQFYGARYNGEEDDIADLNPKAFHKLVTFYHRELRVPMVFDTSANEEVWNFPAWKTELKVKETTSAELAALININTATVEELDVLPLVGPSRAYAVVNHREMFGPFQSIEELEEVDGVGRETMAAVYDFITVDPFQRTFEMTAYVTITTDGVNESHVDGAGDPKSSTKTYRYTLTTDGDGVVVDGIWQDERNHPDFAWIPYHNPHNAGSGNSENPYLEWGAVLETVGEDYERH